MEAPAAVAEVSFSPPQAETQQVMPMDLATPVTTAAQQLETPTQISASQERPPASQPSVFQDPPEPLQLTSQVGPSMTSDGHFLREAAVAPYPEHSLKYGIIPSLRFSCLTRKPQRKAREYLQGGPQGAH